MISRIVIKAVFLGAIISGCSDERPDASRDQKPEEKSETRSEDGESEYSKLSPKDLEFACSGLQGTEVVGEAKMASVDGKSCVPLSEGVEILQGTYRADRRNASYDLKIVGKIFLMTDEQREEEDYILSSLRMGHIEIKKDGRTLFHTWKSTCDEAASTQDLRLAIMYDDIEQRSGRKFLVIENHAYQGFPNSSDKPVKYGCFRNGEFVERNLLSLE